MKLCYKITVIKLHNMALKNGKVVWRHHGFQGNLIGYNLYLSLRRFLLIAAKDQLLNNVLNELPGAIWRSSRKIVRRRFCGGSLILKDHLGRHQPSAEDWQGPDIEAAVLTSRCPNNYHFLRWSEVNQNEVGSPSSVCHFDLEHFQIISEINFRNKKQFFWSTHDIVLAWQPFICIGIAKRHSRCVGKAPTASTYFDHRLCGTVNASSARQKNERKGAKSARYPIFLT